MRKKGFILSFGDIILPFVGIGAIGLLVVAGKLFFMNGFRPSVGVVPESVPESLVPPLSPAFVPGAEAKGEETPPPASPSVQTGEALPEESYAVSPSQGGDPVPLEITATPVTDLPAKETPVIETPTPRPAASARPAAKSQGPVWRVQVGAYGSKSGANEIVSKLARSGYKATVYSGTKYHKVWVQAGNSKQSAEAVAARLKKAGFPGSYVVPPSSR